MAENRLQIFRTAVAELGDVAAEQLVAFIRQKYGVRIEVKYVPFYKATIRDKDGVKPVSPIRQPPVPAAAEPSVATTTLPQTTDSAKLQDEAQAV